MRIKISLCINYVNKKDNLSTKTAKNKNQTFFAFAVFCSSLVFIYFFMLKALFSSKARVKLLTTFLLNPDEEYFIRELTRRLDEQINSIRRELDNLKKVGLLKSRIKNRKKYYYTNKEFIIYNELRDIVLKAMNNDADLIRKISKTGEVELLLLSGVFVGKESNVDLLVVGNIDKDKLQKLLSDQFKKGEDVKFTNMTKKDFLYRLECKDKFIRDFIADDKTIVAINKLKKEIEKIRP